MPAGKFRSITLLILAEVAAMSLWFVSAATLPEMLREFSMSPMRQAAMSSGVQIGFVIGAMLSAVLGLADRYDPRKVLAASAIGAGLINLTLLISTPGSSAAILARFLTGALLAGVYPVGMKIASGWGVKDRGLLVGILVGALTLGSASPHFVAVLGGADWRITITIVSVAAMTGGIMGYRAGLGPHHAIAPKFDARALITAWTNRRIRLAYAGYLGHMWELYAMWAWIAAATTVSYHQTLPLADAEQFAKLTAFVAIGAGGFACVFAGYVADRLGKAETAIIAMALSGASAVATALTFGGAAWITFIIVVIWGITIIADSAQFSALVADATPPERAGTLLSFQTALGFALTFVTVQVTPALAETFGWPLVLGFLSLGPIFGIVAMARLRAIQ